MKALRPQCLWCDGRNQRQPLSRAISNVCSQKPPDEVINLFRKAVECERKQRTPKVVFYYRCVFAGPVCGRNSAFSGGSERGGSWRRGSQNFPFTSSLPRPNLWLSSQMSSPPFSALCNSTPDDSNAAKTHVWIVTVKLSNLQTGLWNPIWGFAVWGQFSLIFCT